MFIINLKKIIIIIVIIVKSMNANNNKWSILLPSEKKNSSNWINKVFLKTFWHLIGTRLYQIIDNIKNITILFKNGNL